MRQPKNPSERVIKKLENEIVVLEQDLTAIIRKKYKMEEEIRQQKAKIEVLELTTRSEVAKQSTWKKIALLLGAAWAVFLSFCGFERK
jgi:septal ring factor EnvC (AmiA/AmiB activator)